MTAPASNPPAGFYDHEGRQRWWDGSAWTDHFQSVAAAPATHQPIQVTVQAPVQTDSRKARDKAVYTRQQTGHSILLWVLLACCGVGIPGLIYYSASPNHYWHA